MTLYRKTTPPHAWWESVPDGRDNGPTLPSPVNVSATCLDVRRFYVFPLATRETPMNATPNIVFVSPEDNGWSFLSKEIRFGFEPDEEEIANLLFSCYDISANKTLFENVSPLNFSSWENGSIGFSYLLPFKHVLKFVFPNPGRMQTFCAILVGQLIRGVV